MNLYKKTYEIFGMVEKSCVFKIGSGFIRADFEKGSLSTSGVIPASFTTSDPVVQYAIEASDKFKNGIIKEGSNVVIGSIDDMANNSIDIQDSKTGNKISEIGGEANGGGKVDYPEVTTGQAARAILSVEPYNIPIGRLQKNDEIKIVASEMNVLFSNWK